MQAILQSDWNEESNEFNIARPTNGVHKAPKGNKRSSTVSEANTLRNSSVMDQNRPPIHQIIAAGDVTGVYGRDESSSLVFPVNEGTAVKTINDLNDFFIFDASDNQILINKNISSAGTPRNIIKNGFICQV